MNHLRIASSSSNIIPKGFELITTGEKNTPCGFGICIADYPYGDVAVLYEELLGLFHQPISIRIVEPTESEYPGFMVTPNSRHHSTEHMKILYAVDYQYNAREIMQKIVRAFVRTKSASGLTGFTQSFTREQGGPLLRCSAFPFEECNYQTIGPAQITQIRHNTPQKLRTV